MKNLQAFNFNGVEVRAESRGEEVWFCLKDVCKVLGFTNHRMVKDRLNTPGVCTAYLGVVTGTKADGTPAMQKVKTTFINEANLYRVVFQSRKPEAEKFVDWVTSEVLPSIRKHGAYLDPSKLDELIRSPETMIKLLTELHEEQARRRELSRVNARLMHTSKTYTATTIAKELGFRNVRDFNKRLYADGIQYRQNGVWVPYAQYTEAGLMINKQDRNGYYSTKWTQKGRTYLLNKYSEEAAN